MSENNWKPTACILCECNCGIEVQLGGEDDRRLIRVRGDKKHPSSLGYACEKAHRLDFYQHARDRITEPLRRREDGTFEVIDWDTAISEVAARLSAVKDRWGGESIFYYGGGGQGNHLPGAYAVSTRRALGSRYRSSALAQEKTGEFWVLNRIEGTYTRGDFEHCQVALFLGKNPWQSHGMARARVTLKAIAKDANRSMIVVDPRHTETARLADIHLQVRPGCDAWLLAALLGVLIDEDLLDHEFLAQRAEGVEPVLAALRQTPIADYCERAGVDEALVRRAARLIGSAESVATYEDLGVQMNRHSTLVSYLHRLVYLLTGNFAKKGTRYAPTPLVPLASGASRARVSPVVGARIIGGLVPCNVIAEETLAEHDKRYRAMIVESANPAHSLADSKSMREALRSMDTVVVIDVAMTETAKLADYVLPASTQFEKAEATFFNFEFPHNSFHLRPRLMKPPEGPLPEAEIHARLVEALGALTDDDLAPLHAAAKQGRAAYAAAFMQNVMPHPRLSGLAPAILWRTLAPTLPEALREGAVLWGLAYRATMTFSASLARAGFDGPPGLAAEKLFDSILNEPNGFIFAVDRWEDAWKRLGHNGKVRLHLPDLLEAVETLKTADPPEVRANKRKFPFVLSAGERRSFTANTILRDPSWRKKDPRGTLRLSSADASDLGVQSGDEVELTTRRGSVVVPVEVSNTMQAGHVSLPNGLGVDYPSEDGTSKRTGVALNELTASDLRDPFAGTPWHKHVPARIQKVGPDAQLSG